MTRLENILNNNLSMHIKNMPVEANDITPTRDDKASNKTITNNEKEQKGESLSISNTALNFVCSDAVVSENPRPGSNPGPNGPIEPRLELGRSCLSVAQNGSLLSFYAADLNLEVLFIAVLLCFHQFIALACSMFYIRLLSC